MSHFRLRKQNNCLNCGTFVHGRFCHNCGQENIEPKETFWHLVTHFVYDVTHFDGKFFSTVKYLLIKPGFLSKEYLRGKRTSYLNPIRMYVFVSAFFFLFFFAIFKTNFKNDKQHEKKTATERKAEIASEISGLHEASKALKAMGDAAPVKHKEDKIKDDLLELNAELDSLKKDSTYVNRMYNHGGMHFGFSGKEYKNRSDYDSIQNILPPAKKDGWLRRKLTLKNIELNKEYKDDQTALSEKILERFLHSFPQIFFVSLPLIGLLLMLLYVRRKTFYYVDHILYLIHVYCAMFIIMFLLLAVNETQDMKHLSWTSYLMLPLSLYAVWYIYKSMRNFYGQRRGKTILKFIVLLSLSFVVIILLLLVSLIFSLFAV